jgi:23S rRNA (pseudouridine1915-N3)-methyltransferase
MRISLLAVGTRLPAWIGDGFETYRRRLPGHIRLELVEIPGGGRAGRDAAAAARNDEGERLLKRVAADDLLIALDERGRECSTTDLAHELERWLAEVPRVALAIGGADGLAPACRERASSLWSLSRLTLPHGLVRVLVAEQLYRAWTVLAGHPYHRA